MVDTALCRILVLIISVCLSDTHDTFAKGLFSLRPAGSVGVENKVVWRADLMLAESIDRESIVDPAKTLKLTIMVFSHFI